MKLNFITQLDKIEVISDQVQLGFIKDSAFFPNSAMMFKAEWLLEIAEFMQNRIDLGKIHLHYRIKKDIKW